jgi:vacuolar protein sorting-associated protein 13A/C
MTPKRNPREFFQFAGQAVLSKVHERNARWSWTRLKERRDDRIAYLDCYVADKLGKATENQMRQLEDLERKLSFEDIRFYRSIAKSRLKREKAVLAAEEKRRKELEARESQQQQQQQGWLSSWWYGQQSSASGSENTENKVKLDGRRFGSRMDS